MRNTGAEECTQVWTTLEERAYHHSVHHHVCKRRPIHDHLMYTICPFHEVVNDHYRVQMEALELQARQKSVAALASQKEVPAQ